MAKRWFKEAVKGGPTSNLGGWKKGKSARTRRRLAVASRPKTWNPETKYRSAGRALQALANVTKDKTTKRIARSDAKYFFRKLR